MIEPLPLAALEPEALRRAVRRALPQLGLADDWAAEALLGAEAPIDLVARDPGGRAAVVQLAAPGEELAAVALALAQRAWLEPRLADWRQLAPERRLRPELGVRALVVGGEFPAAARAAAGAGVELWRAAALRHDGQVGLLLARIDDGPGPAAPPRAGRPNGAGLGPRGALASVFRPGGSEDELGLSPAERREFD